MSTNLSADEIARIKSLNETQAIAERRSLRITISKASDACLGIGISQGDSGKRFGPLPDGVPSDAQETLRLAELALKQFDEARKSR
jgi:hypothetical protein